MTEIPKEAIEAASAAMHSDWISVKDLRASGKFPAFVWTEIGMEAALKAAAPFILAEMQRQLSIEEETTSKLFFKNKALRKAGTYNDGIEAAAHYIEGLAEYGFKNLAENIRTLKK